MKYLLDTQVWLWGLTQPDRIGVDTKKLLESPDSELHLSSVCSWELTIKWRLGKLVLPATPDEIVRNSLTENRLIELTISHKHTCAVSQLPDHHKDPFDRLLLAQALSEGMKLITADDVLKDYRVPLQWALD
jgi:PIN domain nuclease of toxin-antitoxin system